MDKFARITNVRHVRNRPGRATRAIRKRRKNGVRDDALLVGRIREVGIESITIEGAQRVRILTNGTHVVVRARPIRGEYIAETVVTDKETA